MNSNGSRGTNIVGVRAYNDRLVLAIIRNSGKIPKVEIARKTGLSATAVSSIVNNLEKNRLVRREKVTRGRVGQPSMPFSINPAGAFSLGLKIGRRSSEMVLIDFLGKVIDLEVLEYDCPQKSPVIRFALESSRRLISELSECRQKRISGLGVVMPNEIWKWEKLFRTPQVNLKQWRDNAHLKELKEQLGLPVLAMNDATAACGAELMLNRNLSQTSFLYFFIGWFIGGGIVIDSKLYPGRSENAGALGSMLVNSRAGQSKQLIYVSSISALEEKLIASGAGSEFKWDDGGWQLDDKVIDAWVDEAAYGIAQACAAASSVIDFEAIIIDGVMPSRIREKIFDRTLKLYQTLDLTGLPEAVFLQGQIGPQARSIGAACLPLISSFSMDFDVLFKGIARADHAPEGAPRSQSE